MRLWASAAFFSRAYAAASPDEQAALPVWMRDIVLPRKERRNDLANSRRSAKDSIAARDRRIPQFPLSTQANDTFQIAIISRDGNIGYQTDKVLSGSRMRDVIQNSSVVQNEARRYCQSQRRPVYSAVIQ